ncbi:hypothetical protein A3D08_03160 [Candidatus Roizmanbacteria bacterium RIFCSPHIGHO2_02_FULL_43_11]|uniref:(d)CMP kinase n=1 Tax=Candidatus Roizmanbacteria bacterium RIFCSPHIGHO2_02_FULL_43_11 TaxID=1802043 RepID=A0A1F7HEJ1_9BACT|nr:MAG: hypothetical protein A3D08_03160 [Candidatus Roizmanbacteria bacterium RIFCSPHIGHO2_02_FULL_43_11]
MTSSGLYDNITLSGGAGSGKSLLFGNLRSCLEPQGWHFLQAGEMMRDKTNERLNPAADLLPVSHHQSVEENTRDILTTKTHFVIDAWLAGFVARDLPKTLRVLVYMSDEDERARRVAKRDGITPDEAMRLIRDREDRNIQFWRSIYGDYDFWDRKYYQLTIDSTYLNPQKCLQRVLDTMGLK